MLEQHSCLLVGSKFQSARSLIDWLQRRRYQSAVVSTFRNACQSIQSGRYDIILSEDRLPDGSGLALVERFAGMPVTLLISHPVEDGCIWLPGVLHGVHCWGAATLWPNEFVQTLEEVIARNMSDREASHLYCASE